MKRSAPPQRKTPLARATKPLKRTPLKRATTPARRTQPKKSTTRKLTRPALRELHAAIREQVYARDGYRCRLAGVAGAGRCFGDLTPHHRRKASQGGTYSVDNLAALCVGHNDRLESDAALVAIAKAMTPPLVLDRHTANVERFWSYVDKRGPVPAHRPKLGRCWVWTQKPGAQGYGRFTEFPGVVVTAHRFALSLVQQLTPGMEVDHLCRNRMCVRQSHLEEVIPAVNRQRQGLANRRDECARGHPMVGDNVHVQNGPGSYRHCWTCRRMTPEERKAHDEAAHAR